MERAAQVLEQISSIFEMIIDSISNLFSQLQESFGKLFSDTDNDGSQEA